ncbi:Cell division cycle protein 123 [Blattella germanica]|nr:Cell division cycle protein 123 [Blattella germanica]
MAQASNESASSYNNWYPQFKDVALKSIIIPIDDSVCDYLLEDSTLVLPEEVHSVVGCSNFSDQEGECSDEDSDHSEIKQPSFPAFSEALKKSLASLGGEVFIKLNWSAPVDAAWITSNKSLKCTTVEDVYLLLKSSDILAKELTFIKETQGTHMNTCVVMKKWCDIYPGHEFRCFVVKHKLVAISQRDYKTYYGYIALNKFDIIEDIENFFKERIKGKYKVENCEFDIIIYIFDIVRKSRHNIKLIDFGPFDSKKTKSLLFTWEELQELVSESDTSPEFRFLGEELGFQPNPYQHYGLPADLEGLQISSESSIVDAVIEDVNKQT